MPHSTRRDRRVARLASAVLLAAAAVALAAPAAHAQFAGVPAPPPRPAKAAPPPVAARPKSDSLSRLRRERDSLALVQRLDIQAWVDSAAPALARRPPADSARRPTPAVKRPEGITFRPAARGDGRSVPRVVEGRFTSVADRRGALYLRPWPCQATYLPTPSRSV